MVLFLLLGACDRSPEPTAIQRGERLFRPVADQLAATIAGDLKKSDPGGFDRYLKEIGAKEEADLPRKISMETLAHYAEALSVSSAKEADLKAGRFEDAMNLRKINSAIGSFTKSKLKVPHVCQVLLGKYNAGEWKTGLELEFSARILEGHLLLPKD
ncbi:MAG TPA: hypothetical protein VMU54_10780 [Planctomycetota bacterium]|nr:hypothetical protein [Planctomycetota bacterium]